MPRRERIDFSPSIERLGVEADAGDSFVPGTPRQPGTPNAGANALRLASALGGLNSSLQGFVNQNAREATRETASNLARFKREENARGRQAASKAAAEAGKAVRERILPPNASPYFIQGMKEQNARILGDQYHQDMMTSMQTLNPVTGDINAHIKENSDLFISGNPGLEDPITFAEFQRKAAGINQNLRFSFLSQQGKAFRKEKAAQTFQESTNMMSDMQLRASESMVPVNVQAMGANLKEFASSDRFLGQDPATTRKSITDAVIQRALDSNNPRILDALLHTGGTDVETGQNVPSMSEFPDVSGRILAAKNQIRRNLEHNEDRDFRIRGQQITEAGYSISSIFGQRFAINPAAPISEAEAIRYRKMFPDFDTKVRKMRDIFSRLPSAPASLRDRDLIQSLIDTGKLNQDELVLAGREQGLVTSIGVLRINAGDFGALSKRIIAQNKAAKEGKNILRNPAVLEAENDAMNSLSPAKDIRGNYFQGTDPGAIKRWEAVMPGMSQRWKAGFSALVQSQEANLITNPNMLQQKIAEYNREFLKNHEVLIEKNKGEREGIRRKLEIDVPLSGITGPTLRRIILEYRATKTGPMAAEIRRLWPNGVDTSEYQQWFSNISERLGKGRKK